MSERITIKFRDGTERVFYHQGRPGGSYTIHSKFDNGMITVEDEYGKKVSFPMDLVLEVVELERRY